MTTGELIVILNGLITASQTNFKKIFKLMDSMIEKENTLPNIQSNQTGE